MTLTVTPDNVDITKATRLTVVSDRRITPAVPAVTKAVTITISSADESRSFNGEEVIKEATPEVIAPIWITDSRGFGWVVQADDGRTAVLVRS